jgi:hypothetical protein
VVVIVGLTVGEEAKVEVAPNREVGVAVRLLEPPAAKAVCVAMVLKTELSGSSVGVGSEAPAIDRVHATSRRPVQAKVIRLSLFRMGTQKLCSRPAAILA